MAKQRMVNTQFWDDKYIKKLGPHGKLIFAYLITGPLTTISGAYEITLDHIYFHTGIPEIEIASWLEKFEQDDKATFCDGWMLVHNAIDHQTLTNLKITTGIEESVKRCPDWIKYRLSIRYRWLSHLNPNSDSYSDSNNGVPPVAADAAAEEYPVERRIWKDGIDLLVKSALTETQARPLLGRLAKDYGSELLAECIAATQAKNPADPKGFLIGALRKRSNPNPEAVVGKYVPPEEPDIFPECASCNNTQFLNGDWKSQQPCPDCQLEKAA